MRQSEPMSREQIDTARKRIDRQLVVAFYMACTALILHMLVGISAVIRWALS